LINLLTYLLTRVTAFHKLNIKYFMVNIGFSYLKG
jgi:hypothetical protein